MDAYALPNKSDEEKQIRTIAIQQATKDATLVPFRIMETALSASELIREMVEKGNPGSVTDAGVGALALRSCIRGAFLNVKINAGSLTDKVFAREIVSKGCEIEIKAMKEEEAILRLVDSRINKK